MMILTPLLLAMIAVFLLFIMIDIAAIRRKL